MRAFILAGCLAATAASSLAQDGTSASPAPLTPVAPRAGLSPAEREAVGIAQRWQATASSAGSAIAAPGGVVKFVYGIQQVNIVCAVLQVCDVELQSGELVNNVHIGDNRFGIEPAISGTGAGQTVHVIIKPFESDIETTLIITTNRRTYRMHVRATKLEFMPSVSFTYPEDAMARWEAVRQREPVEVKNGNVLPTGENIGDLDFNYAIAGKAPWKPVRVYNNGRKTIIQMPEAMKQTEAPTLLVVRRDGSLFSDDETAMVNYRVHGDRYIVDQVFDKAILIAGVGSTQDRITITREK